MHIDEPYATFLAHKHITLEGSNEHSALNQN